MEFKLSNCILRPWRLEDAESLVIHANNAKIASNLRDGFPFPYTSEHARQWLKMTTEDKNNILLAIDIEGKSVGGIGIMPKTDVYRLSAEIGYWLSERYWNKGIMTEAIKAMVKWSFENLQLIRISAGIFEKNTPSMKALKKAGFKLEAIHSKAVVKNGEIMDEYVYAILK